MKTKKVNGKLSLKKNTIANLESHDMKYLMGGVNLQANEPVKTIQLTNYQVSCLNCFGTITCKTCEIQTCSVSSVLPPTNDQNCDTPDIHVGAIDK